MKRILFMMMALFCCAIINGQVSLPQVTPTSPEAASLGRYGDFDLTNATGRMSYSVPIHTITAGAYTWPISLNYSYGGLILEGKPSLSGLGWNLSAYASITKQARGLPDGHPDGYYGQSNVEAKINAVVADYQNDGLVNTTSWTDLQKFLEKTYDSEVDIYRLNLAGDSFSFKIKRTGTNTAQVYGLSKSNYIIDVTVDNTQEFEMASFVVTDAMGIKYYFDADDREQVVQEPAGTTAFSEDNTTAWMLSRILYPTGQDIVFDYAPDRYFDYNFAARATEYDMDASAPGASLQGNYAADWYSNYSDEFRVSELDRQLLNTITFPSGTIRITRTNNSGRLLISKLEVKNNFGAVINTYEFTYQGVRDALVKIQKNGETLYDFEYYGVHTPGTIPSFTQSVTDPKPFDQDYWRFYNQAGNNRALHLPFDGPNFVAIKTPNFSATRLGALKRIIYPTKGYSEISYQQNQVKEDNVPGSGNQNEAFNDGFVISVDAKTSNSDRYATITKTFTSPVRAYLYHKIKGNVSHGNSIYLTIEETTGSSSSAYNHCYSPTSPVFTNYYPINIADARSKLVETDPNDPNSCQFYPNPPIKLYLDIDHDPDNNCAWYPPTSDTLSQAMGCTSDTTVDAHDDSGGHFWIIPGTYTFTIDVQHLSQDDLYGEIGLSWYDPSQDPYINVDVGGIRVSRLANYDHTGELTGVTHYNYNDRFGFSEGRQNQIPTLSYRHEWNHIDNNQTTLMVLNEYLLNSYTALESNHGVPVYYSTITTHKNQSLNASVNINGVVRQNFNHPEEDVSLIYPLIPRGEDLTKVIPGSTQIRDKNDATVSSTTRSYQTVKHTVQSGTNIDASSNHPWSFVYYKYLNNTLNWDVNCYDYNPDCHDNLRSLHTVALYKEVNSKRYLTSESTTTDDILTLKSYSYNGNQLLKESTVSTSDGKALKTKNYYPDELGNTTLTTANRIATSIKTETYKGNLLDNSADVKLSTQNTIYATDGSNYLPNIVQTSKGTNSLENRMEYHDYDNKGNPLEVSMESGTRIVYIWGYNQTLPVAKIENATYSEVSSYVANIQNLSNSDNDRTYGSAGSEGALRNALNNLRSVTALSDALITTYTYDPLIGVTSVTDPDGNVIYYEYDNLNRLKQVIDKDGKILSENQYHYKN